MEEFVDSKGMAKKLSVPVSTVDYLRRKGEIPTVYVGKHARYIPDEVVKKLRGINAVLIEKDLITKQV